MANKAIKWERYLVLMIDNLTHTLDVATVFYPKLDLHTGYYQRECHYIITFATHKNFWQYVSMVIFFPPW